MFCRQWTLNKQYYQYWGDYDIVDEGINHIWDAIDSGGIFEYWDENENHERTID